MKPTLILLTLLSVALGINAQIYVVEGGTGDGTSWEKATNLTNALQSQQQGEIWVAKGTYVPTTSDDRTASFMIKDGVKLYGGFSGNERDLIQRNIQLNPTILSGEIGQPGIADNSFNVLFIRGASNATIIDGFIITAGNASGEGNDGARARCGGGLYNHGMHVVSTPSIVNCIFEKNRGRDGAAVYNNGRGGESSPNFTNCIFRKNEADLDGGAMYNDGRKRGMSKPTFKHCTFEENMGTYGGAIFNATTNGICNLYLEDCAFNNNSAFLRGGAVFNMSGNQNCIMELLDCTFTGNYPDDQSRATTSNTTRINDYQIKRP